MEVAPAAVPTLEMQQISKRFGSTQALENVSLTLYPGEIHALLGENGAGKSTLIKIMTGVYQPDTGEIRLDGRPIRVHNPVDAQVQGIAAIYQEPLMYPDLSVAENIFITHRGRGLVVHWSAMERDAKAILAKIGVQNQIRDPVPFVQVDDLSTAVRVRVGCTPQVADGG